MHDDSKQVKAFLYIITGANCEFSGVLRVCAQGMNMTDTCPMDTLQHVVTSLCNNVK